MHVLSAARADPALNAALLARYGDQRLPRYTSYPTAPHFGPAIGEAQYRRWLRDLPAAATGSLYLHIPFCRAMCWYCGCHTTVARRDDPILAYLEALHQELRLVAGSMGCRLAVRHVHFGGGTPTILKPEQFLGLIELLHLHFALPADAEIAIEIDPRTLTRDMIAALGHGGVRRASLGVQSFDPDVQRAINRVQSFDETAAAVVQLREVGVRGLNLDLVYGLPHQTLKSCVETVSRCLTLRPDRFAVFGYAHVPSLKKHQRKIEAGDLPSPAARHEQAEAIASLLTDAGYRRIGLDHFALPDDAMARAEEGGNLHRNFQGYTTDPCEVLIGVGASAIGRLPQGYVQNEVVIRRYAERVARGELPIARGHALTHEDAFRAALIERVMCDLRVDVAQVCRAQGRPVPDLATTFPALSALAHDGLISMSGSVVEVEPKARYLVRAAASAFDAYL